MKDDWEIQFPHKFQICKIPHIVFHRNQILYTASKTGSGKSTIPLTIEVTLSMVPDRLDLREHKVTTQSWLVLSAQRWIIPQTQMSHTWFVYILSTRKSRTAAHPLYCCSKGGNRYASPTTEMKASTFQPDNSDLIADRKCPGASYM
jgi:hypothetical protein